MFGNFGWFMFLGSAPFLLVIVICLAMFGVMGWFMLRGNRRGMPHQDLPVPQDQQRSPHSYEHADPLPRQQTEDEQMYEQPRR